jgi:hypothetical protein
MATSSGKPGPKALHSANWKPGQSGNPSGRPRKTPVQRDFETLCKHNADKALAAVLAILQDADSRPADKLRAAEFIADRGFGKPVGRDVLVTLDADSKSGLALSRADEVEILRLATDQK